MSKKLTAATVAQLKPRRRNGEPIRTEIADAQCAGLYLVIQPNGAKSWAVRFRSPVERDAEGQRKAKKLTLGTLANGHEKPDGEPQIGGPLTLSEARALAAAALRKVNDAGIDPTHERRVDKAMRREAAINASLIDDAMREFLRRYRGRKLQGLRKSTKQQTENQFGLKPDPHDPGKWIKSGGGILRHWSGRPIASISKRDVIALIDTMVDDGAPIAANRTLTKLKTFFSWAVSRDLIAISPAAMVHAPAEERTRDRVLTEDEIRAVWTAASSVGYPFGSFVQMLLLTAARRDELRQAPWTEFDLEARVWRLPGERAKNGREHLVPLVQEAMDVLERIPRKGRYLFAMTEDKAISGLTRPKRRLDGAVLTELQKSDPEATLRGWTLHDIRRTVASGLQRLGFSIEVVEAVLNHKSGTLRGVAGIYARHDYFPEKTKALEAWAREIERIVSGKSADIVPMRMVHG